MPIEEAVVRGSALGRLAPNVSFTSIGGHRGAHVTEALMTGLRQTAVIDASAAKDCNRCPAVTQQTITICREKDRTSSTLGIALVRPTEGSVRLAELW